MPARYICMVPSSQACSQPLHSETDWLLLMRITTHPSLIRLVTQRQAIMAILLYINHMAFFARSLRGTSTTSMPAWNRKGHIMMQKPTTAA